MTDLKTIILKNDATPTGSTSFADETLEDFLLSINAMPKKPLDDADKWHIDKHLVQKSIKPVFNITKSDAFITLYKRLFEQMDTYCEKHDLTVIDHSLIKDRCLITNKQDYIESLTNFAKALDQEHQDLIARSRYKYAQQVLKESQDTLLTFFNLYNQVLTGFPTSENQDALKNFKGLKKKLNQILNSLDLPENFFS